jgi:hypothetical protein
LRSVRVIAAAALAALMLFSCTTSHGPSASSTRLASQSPLAVNPADSKAADFRTRLDLLLGEHVMVVAKQSAATGRSDEYTSYLHLLTANGSDLTELIRSALGDTAAARFDKIWSAQNDNLVTYTIGLVTHNTSKAAGAISGLVSGFVPQFSQFVSDETQIPLDPTIQLANERVLEIKAMIDDEIAQRYSRMYADLRTAYGHVSLIGNVLAARIVQEFPDKFPGSATSPAVDLRVSMNNLMQEHVYLATMTTSAAAGGRRAEQTAAARALADNAAAIGTLLSALFGAPTGAQFGKIWSARDVALIGYASASTPAAKQSALTKLNDVGVTQFSGFIHDSIGLAPGIARPAIEAQVAATITVIDDQRSRSLAGLGVDDRSANSSMGTLADLIAIATVAKHPTWFA